MNAYSINLKNIEKEIEAIFEDVFLKMDWQIECYIDMMKKP